MKQALTTLRRYCNAFLSILIVIGMAALCIDILWGVFSRYLLGAQSRWTDELATVLMIWTAMLGAALVYGEKGHLGVDILAVRLDIITAKWTEAFGHLVAVSFASCVLIWGGGVMVAGALESGQILPALNMSKSLVYLVAPMSGICIVCYGLDSLVTLVIRHSDSLPSEQAKDAV